MNTKKIKYWLKTQKGKNFLISSISIFITFIIMLIIMLVLLSNVNKHPSDEVIAYNRNSSSGTREAFEDAIHFDAQKQQFSENVLEVKSNDYMKDKVSKSEQTFGYVSLSTITEKNENGELQYSNQDELSVLKLEGVDPLEAEADNWSNYQAKRYFNVFFRVDESLSDLIYNNSFMAYENGTSPNNLWSTSSDVSAEDFDDLYSYFDEYNLKNDNVKKSEMMYSYLYWNWMAASASVGEVISASLSSKSSDFQNGLINFINNVYELNPNLFDSSVSDGKNNVDIYTMGSTSVTTSLNLTFPKFNEDINSAISSSNHSTLPKQNLINVQLNYGSSDAFAEDPQTVNDHIWLGFQSRSRNDQEIENWNYSPEQIPTSENEGIYVVDESKVYFSFETDPLVFIINSNQTVTVNNGNNSTIKIKPTDIDIFGINMIYTQNASFEDLYALNLLSGEEV